VDATHIAAQKIAPAKRFTSQAYISRVR
jgi:hypothetical protein